MSKGKRYVEDLTGQTIHGIQVLRKHKLNTIRGHRAGYICLCVECGEEMFKRGDQLHMKTTGRCVHCSRKNRDPNKQKPSEDYRQDVMPLSITPLPDERMVEEFNSFSSKFRDGIDLGFAIIRPESRLIPGNHGHTMFHTRSCDCKKHDFYGFCRGHEMTREEYLKMERG